jgi:hypothetical protein
MSSSSKNTICQNFIEIVTVNSNPRLKINTPIFTGNVGIGTSVARVALDILSTSAILAPAGTDQQRPSGMKGLLRYNTTADKFECFSGSGTGSWVSLGNVIANTFNITGITATSEGWTVTTNNVAATGAFQVHVTPAYDDSTVVTKATPFFTSASAITISPPDWPSGTGWSVSANVNPGTAWQAFNSSTATSQNWATSASDNQFRVNDYIFVKYPSANKLDSVRITSIWNNGAFPVTFHIQGANDTLHWDHVQTFTGQTWVYNVAITFRITEPHLPYKYWRFYLSTNANDNNETNFTDIRFNTIWSSGRLLTTSHALSNNTQFKIIMTDRNGDPVSMTTQLDSLNYNIMIIKGGSVVLSGLYQLSAINNTITKLS